MDSKSTRKLTSFRSLFYLLLLTTIHPLFSQNVTFTWDGGGGANTDWETATNWVGDVVPGSTDFAEFNSTDCSACTVTTSAGTQAIRRIFVRTGADVTLDLSLNVTQGLSNVASVTIEGTGNINFGTTGNNRTFGLNVGNPITSSAIVATASPITSSPSMTVASSTVLTISNCANGIRFITSDGSITNNGTINISGAGTEGIRLDANATSGGITFDNNGTITSSSSTSTTGIYSTNGGANFNNNGTITLSNSTSTGITIDAGTFTNAGTLTFNTNAAATALLMNGGIFNHNSGTIDINDATTQAILMSSGDFNNSSILDLTSCSSTYGIAITGASATFDNTSTITIPDATTNGIYITNGILTNTGASAEITISAAVTNASIQIDAGTLDAKVDGTITLSNSTLYGIGMDGGTGGTFQNDGTLNVSSAGTYGVRMDDTGALFHNQSNGILNITNATASAFLIAFTESGTLTNDGDINLSAASTQGLLVQGTGVVNANNGGTITISNATSYGINFVKGTINNDGDLNISSAMATSITMNTNTPEFNNTSNGVITMDDFTASGLLVNNGTFNNSGSISSNTTAGAGTRFGLDFTGGTLNNEGIINASTTGNYAIRLNDPSTTLNNLSSGAINVTAALLGALYINTLGGSVSNDGIVTLSSASTRSIWVRAGSFANNASGVFNISSATTDAFDVDIAVSNAGTLNLTTKTTPILTDNLLDITANFTNTGLINLTGDGLGTSTQQLITITSSTLDNSGTIVITNLGGDIPTVVGVAGTLTNIAGGSIDVNSGIIDVSGSLTNNGLIVSTHSSSLGISASGTATNNAFFSYSGGLADTFASGAGTIAENGLDIDVPANMTLDAGSSETVADIGIDVAYSWYNNAANTKLLATNDATGLLTFEDIKANAGPAHSDQLFTVFGSTVVFTANNILPVELLFFKATGSQTGIKVEWSTATELNNDRFEIYKSEDGMNWSLAQTVTGNGTTKNRHDYSWQDTTPIGGINYYQLRQVDFNGDSETFKSIYAIWSGDGFEVSVFPNPVVCELHFSLPGTLPHSAVKLFDLTGTQISIDWKGNDSINMRSIPSGTYFVVISLDGYQKSFRILKY